MPAVDYTRIASLYDGLVTDTSDIGYFVQLAREAFGPVAELMAGTGRISIPLIEAGMDVTCVDSSPEMLRVLEDKLVTKGLRARTLCQDVTHMNLDAHFRLIFIGFHSFEELVEDADRRACLEAIHRHLQPDGCFVCTLHDIPSRLSSIGPKSDCGWQFVEPGSGRMVKLAVQTEYDRETGVVQGSESFSYVDEDAPFLNLTLRFRLTSAEDFRRLANDCGFEVQSVCADYTENEYQEGTARTAVWTMRPRDRLVRSPLVSWGTRTTRQT